MSIIVDLPELVGRTIVEASTWADRDSMSLRLDNGGILQVTAFLRKKNVPYLHIEVEFPPEKESSVGIAEGRINE